MKFLPLDTDSDLYITILTVTVMKMDVLILLKQGLLMVTQMGLGTNPITVDGMLAAEPGKVNNQGEGYTTPNDLNSNV